MKFWNFVESIKTDKENFVSDYNLLTNMYEKLSELSDEEIINIIKEIDSLKNDFNEELYYFLKTNKLINGDSDFICFRIWILFQGEKLYNDIYAHGNISILDYIKKYNISENEYRYESLYYPIMEELRKRNLI